MGKKSPLRFLYRHSHVSPAQVRVAASRLVSEQKCLRAAAKNKTYRGPMSFVRLPFDAPMQRAVRAVYREKTSGALKYVFVVGIGGSSLGARAVAQAIGTGMHPRPRLIFMEGINDATLQRIVHLVLHDMTTPSEFIVNIISKSGRTVETVVNGEILVDILQRRFGNISDRIVITTDVGSVLWRKARKQHLTALSIPPLVVGRYSVFSAVGLFPLLCAGVDIEALCKGARQAVKDATHSNLYKNAAAVSSIVCTHHYTLGRRTAVIFPFSAALKGVAEWWRQVIAESIGKSRNIKGKKVHEGITPLVATGSEDLHTLTPLVLDGPDDKITFFVWPGPMQPWKVTRSAWSSLAPGAAGKTAGDVAEALYEGIKRAYLKRMRPFVEYELTHIGEYELGYLMQRVMIETVFAACLIGVDPFTQPAVEAYKKEVRTILSRTR